MKLRSSFPTMLLVLGCVFLASPAEGGLDIDLGGSVRLGDHTDLYFAISSRYFDQDRSVVERIGVRYDNRDDLAVSLFIGKRSGKSADHIYSLRRQGLSWWDISMRYGLSPDLWFVRVERDPGPPYGKAYGHWKNHKKDKARKFRLTDTEIRDLMAVRMIHEYYGVPVEVAMEMRGSGSSLTELMSREYTKRHGPGGGKVHRKPHKKGHGKGKKN